MTEPLRIVVVGGNVQRHSTSLSLAGAIAEAISTELVADASPGRGALTRGAVVVTG